MTPLSIISPQKVSNFLFAESVVSIAKCPRYNYNNIWKYMKLSGQQSIIIKLNFYINY